MEDIGRYFVRTDEVAKLIGTSDRSIRRRCERGDVKATKFGRVWLIDRRALMAQLGIAEGVE